MSYFGPLTKNIFDICIKELKKKDTKEKIMSNLIDPLLSEFFNRYSLYIFSVVFIQILILVMLFYIIYTINK